MPDQAKPSEIFTVGQQHYKEIAQALLSAKSAARSIYSACEALVPIANPDTGTRAELAAIGSSAGVLAQQLSELYDQIALTAFQ